MGPEWSGREGARSETRDKSQREGLCEHDTRVSQPASSGATAPLSTNQHVLIANRGLIVLVSAFHIRQSIYCSRTDELTEWRPRAATAPRGSRDSAALASASELSSESDESLVVVRRRNWGGGRGGAGRVGADETAAQRRVHAWREQQTLLTTRSAERRDETTPDRRARQQRTARRHQQQHRWQQHPLAMRKGLQRDVAAGRGLCSVRERQRKRERLRSWARLEHSSADAAGASGVEGATGRAADMGPTWSE